jgi:hypothetical protein
MILLSSVSTLADCNVPYGLCPKKARLQVRHLIDATLLLNVARVVRISTVVDLSRFGSPFLSNLSSKSKSTMKECAHVLWIEWLR